MPVSLIQALALTKRAAAKVNQDLGLLTADKATAIINAADEVLAGKHPDEFPRHLADRFRHPEQHEHERSAGEPGQRTAGRRARHGA
jgi:hypothetical protein